MKYLTSIFIALGTLSIHAAETIRFDRVIPMHSMLHLKKINPSAPLGTPTGNQKDVMLDGKSGRASSSLGEMQGSPLKNDPKATATIRFNDSRTTCKLDMTSDGNKISVPLQRSQYKAENLRFGALTYDEIISGTRWTDYNPKTKGVWLGNEERDGAVLEYTLVWASERNYLLKVIGKIPGKNLSFGEFLYGLEYDVVIEAGND
ncbi:hypothetical protein [Luteolibacter sp. AS25]|uniref:hypothetical protein n=1 Tax=Luteolibacter sp. AS25 TaxID=3135776 RepID=UPI00398B934E